MSASPHFAEAPSRSKNARLGRSDRSLENSSSEPPQTTEETARDRLRAHTGGSERESIPDAADQAQENPEYRPGRIDGRAGKTPFKSDRQSQRGSVRASHETPAEGRDATKLAHRKKSLRREPQHVASVHPQNAPPKETAAAAGQKRENHDTGLQHVGRKDDHVAHTQQKNGASPKRIYCGNNALAHELTSGQARIGKRSECFRKGVGGLHAAIAEGGTEEFIKKWTAPYRKLIEQPLHYGDGPTPAGKFPATLSQCLARGFAVGSIQKAKKKMHEPKQLPDADD